MADIVHQMEHPMIAEMRSQMEQQKEDHERKVAELEDTIKDKDGIIDDATWNYDRNFDQITQLFQKKVDGKTIEVKLTPSEFVESLYSIRNMFYKNDIIYNPIDTIKGWMENIKPEIIYQDRIVTRTETEYIREKEIVICSAVKSTDGRIFMGHRHADCIKTMKDTGIEYSSKPEDQGFITSKNRFVDRKDGYWIQIKAGIESVCEQEKYWNMELHSEDLY